MIHFLIKYFLAIFFVVFVCYDSFSQTKPVVSFDFEQESHTKVFQGNFERKSLNQKSGKFALAISKGITFTTLNNLKPFTTYELICWIKTTKNTSVNFGVKKFGGNQVIKSLKSLKYFKVIIPFTTGFTASKATIFVENLTTKNDLVFIDDIALATSKSNDYKLVWADEFNQNGSVDTLKWTFEKGFIRNFEEQWYQNENAFQNDGLLIIEGKKEQELDKRKNPFFDPMSKKWNYAREFINYTAASIQTKKENAWLYGRFEIKAKVTNLEGTWPAIWTLGTNCNWPSNGEVDIMENYKGDILANFAWGANKGEAPIWDTTRHKVIANFVKNDPNWLDKFHVWTLDWDENRMSIYIDDILLNDIVLNTTFNGTTNCPDENPFRKKHFLLLNLALGGQQGGSLKNLQFPTQFLVDYIRVYQLK